MKKYQCHKVVEAFKISGVSLNVRPDHTPHAIHGNEGEYVAVTQEWIDQHNPQVGGYFVRDPDEGDIYKSAEAFEVGCVEVGGGPEKTPCFNCGEPTVIHPTFCRECGKDWT